MLSLLLLVLLLLLAVDAVVLWRRSIYQQEIRRLRASMTAVERRQADLTVAAEDNRLRLAVALLRRQARIEDELHLVVAVDSNAMYLERSGAILRSMPILVGPERTIGTAPDTVPMAAPRGVRTVARVLGAHDAWEVPEWLFLERGVAAPANRAIPGVLGATALLLDGGTVIYGLPDAGPLSDSTFVLPGAIRARSADLTAIAANLTPGMRVYFY